MTSYLENELRQENADFRRDLMTSSTAWEVENQLNDLRLRTLYLENAHKLIRQEHADFRRDMITSSTDWEVENQPVDVILLSIHRHRTEDLATEVKQRKSLGPWPLIPV